MNPLPEPEPMRTLEEIKEVIQANREAGIYLFADLESAECGKYSGWLMHGGDCDEGFFTEAEWSLIVD